MNFEIVFNPDGSVSFLDLPKDLFPAIHNVKGCGPVILTNDHCSTKALFAPKPAGPLGALHVRHYVEQLHFAQPLNGIHSPSLFSIVNRSTTCAPVPPGGQMPYVTIPLQQALERTLVILSQIGARVNGCLINEFSL